MKRKLLFRLGLVIAMLFYHWRKWSIDAFVAKVKPLHHLLEKKYYFDELYLWISGASAYPAEHETAIRRVRDFHGIA